MTVEVYIGKYVSAEDAHQYINTDEIVEACLTLKKMAGKVENKRVEIDKIENSYPIEGLSKDQSCSMQFHEVANEIDKYANTILQEMNDALKLDIMKFYIMKFL